MSRSDKNFQLLQAAREIYGELAEDQILMIDRISALLRDMGMHGLNRAGIGIAPLNLRPFDSDRGDTRADISPQYSRPGQQIVLERERETQKRYITWIKSTLSMDFKSRNDLLTKKEAGLVLALAMAKKMLAQGDSVSFSQEGRLRSLTSHAVGNPAGAGLMDISGASFEVNRSIPLGATVILIVDHRDEQDTLRALDELHQRRLKACLIVTADPQEVSFDLPEMPIHGLENEQTSEGRTYVHFNRHMRDEAQQLYKDRIETLRDACGERGFSFYFQRTDQLIENNCLVEMIQQTASSARRGVRSYHLGSLSGLNLG